MAAAAILSIIPGLQATAVVGRAYRMVPKKWDSKKKVPMRKNKMVKGFLDITVGLALMKPTASMINSMK